MSELVVVFTADSEIEASLVKGLLEAHGIPTALSSGAARRIWPVNLPSLGQVTLRVHEEHAEEARQLLHDYRAVEAAAPQVIRLRDEFAALEAALEYRFRDPGLLEQALTHRSRSQEDVTGGVSDNESLEFLGDAILGFVIADLLFREFPGTTEGEKSKIKASLVSAPVLARVAERLEVGSHLLLGRGEEKTGGRGKQALLADTCEALVAAVYLDGGLEEARALILREWGPLAERARRPGLLTAVTGDYKSALQELLQARDEPPPDYRVVAEEGPAHLREFSVEVWALGDCLGRARGRSKKEAEQSAARDALARLGAEI
jgi:ribonuclease III